MVNLKRVETLETEHAVKKPSDKDEGKLHVALEKDFDKIGKNDLRRVFLYTTLYLS